MHQHLRPAPRELVLRARLTCMDWMGSNRGLLLLGAPARPTHRCTASVVNRAKRLPVRRRSQEVGYRRAWMIAATRLARAAVMAPASSHRIDWVCKRVSRSALARSVT